jgi:hypothetical protein
MSQKKASFSHVRSIRPLTISEDVRIEVEVLDSTRRDTVADNFDFTVHKADFHANMTSVSSFSLQKNPMSDVEDYTLDPADALVEPVMVPAMDDENVAVALKDMDLDDVPDPTPTPKSPPQPARKIGHHRIVKRKPKPIHSQTQVIATSSTTVSAMSSMPVQAKSAGPRQADPLDTYYQAYQQLAKAIDPVPRRCYFPLWKQRLEQAAAPVADGTFVAPFEAALRAQIAVNKRAGIYPAAITPVETGVTLLPKGILKNQKKPKIRSHKKASQKKGTAHGKGAIKTVAPKKPQVTPKMADNSSSAKFAMTLEYHKEVMKEFLKCQ